MWLPRITTFVCGANLPSVGLVRVPQPVDTALAPSPVYGLIEMPANDVLAMREFWMVMSLSTVGFAGGTRTFGTVVSKTMPPVFFEPSQPVLNRIPGALP